MLPLSARLASSCLISWSPRYQCLFSSCSSNSLRRVAWKDAFTSETKAVKFPLEHTPLKEGFVFLRNGAPIAYVNSCPHARLELDLNDADFFFGGLIQCKVHAALYHAETGICVKGPPRCKRTKPLRRIFTTLKEDGGIYIDETKAVDQSSDELSPEQIKKLNEVYEKHALEKQMEMRADLDLVNARLGKIMSRKKK